MRNFHSCLIHFIFKKASVNSRYMKNFTFIKTFLIVLFFPAGICAQLPNLGTAAQFVLFTSAGAVGNTGISNIQGNVGSHVGAITGFEGIPGVIYNADAVTEQAATDVMAAYMQLLNTNATSTDHIPAYGSGETLFAGVYAIAGASSIAGSLTLDAQGDPNAVFIFKSWGALTTAASTTIYLINSASPNKVFWIAEGAISMAASTNIAGTFISNNGAVDMGDGSTLEGRLLTTGGAVSVYGTHAFIPGSSTLPLGLQSFSGICDGQGVRLKWTTAMANNNEFTIQGSVEGLAWIDLGKSNKVIGSVQYTYWVKDLGRSISLSYYRLLETDPTGEKAYGNTILVQPCTGNNKETLLLYPNPSKGQFNLLLEGDANKVSSTLIYNSSGQRVFETAGFPSFINISKLAPGEYIVHIRLLSSVINRKIIVQSN